MANTKTRTGLQKRLSTNREKRTLKSKATIKIANKADLIRSMLIKNLSPTEIRKKLEARGLSIYPSEIYRVKAEF